MIAGQNLSNQGCASASCAEMRSLGSITKSFLIRSLPSSVKLVQRFWLKEIEALSYMAALSSEILLPTYGYEPLSITNNKTPHPHISACIVEIPSNDSGARYRGVPTIIPVCTSFYFANLCARPKSMSLKRLSSPLSLDHIIFSGLMSRCAIPLL